MIILKYITLSLLLTGILMLLTTTFIESLHLNDRGWTKHHYLNILELIGVCLVILALLIFILGILIII